MKVKSAATNRELTTGIAITAALEHHTPNCVTILFQKTSMPLPPSPPPS
jgi:hypothetical protein